MSETINRGELLAFTTEIVSAHIANNTVDRSGLATLIQSVFDTLSVLASDEPAPAELMPAVPIKKSVTDDYIVCLEDGKKLKMLKRHLMTAYGMTPEAYRSKWSLKADYPMVAPSYALKRQEIGQEDRPRAEAARGRAGACAQGDHQEAACKEGSGLRAEGAAAPWPSTPERRGASAGGILSSRPSADSGRSPEPRAVPEWPRLSMQSTAGRCGR